MQSEDFATGGAGDVCVEGNVFEIWIAPSGLLDCWRRTQGVALGWLGMPLRGAGPETCEAQHRVPRKGNVCEKRHRGPLGERARHSLETRYGAAFILNVSFDTVPRSLRTNLSVRCQVIALPVRYGSA